MLRRYARVGESLHDFRDLGSMTVAIALPETLLAVHGSTFSYVLLDIRPLGGGASRPNPLRWRKQSARRQDCRG